ncbi:MAG: hypothetical protein K8J08_16735 [Thermoanaerobaculia bacterium]|nr:hypothetical protein [Thermoanaerobaculia bacterium]
MMATSRCSTTHLNVAGVRRPWRWISLAGVLLTLLALATPASADTFVVDTEVDAMTTGCSDIAIGDCTLRGAIERANQNPGLDYIYFGFGADNIQLTLTGADEDLNQSGDLDITDTVTIGGGTGVTIDASALGERVFDLRPTTTWERTSLYFLTITGGGSLAAGYTGGAIRCEYYGDLLLAASVLIGNGPVAVGGGLATEGCATDVWFSTITGNSAVGGGGMAILFAPTGIEPDLVTVRNSAIIGNHAENSGGGIVNLVQFPPASLSNTTLSGNTVTGDSPTDEGTAITNFGHMDIEWTTIVADPLSTVTTIDDSEDFPKIQFANSLLVGSCGASTVLGTEGGNLESPGNTCGLDPLVDQVSVADAGLLPLAYNRGYTQSHMLRIDSPAVDDPMGTTSGCPPPDFDQRQLGFPRPQDGNGDGLVRCDIGAIERQFLFEDGFESGDTAKWSSSTL